MNNKPSRVPEYLGHMLDAIIRIENYTAAFEWQTFEANSLTQDAVIRNLEVIGEAAHNVLRSDPPFVIAHPEVPRANAYRMSNALAHGYPSVDIGNVWRTVPDSLPAPKIQLIRLLHS